MLMLAERSLSVTNRRLVRGLWCRLLTAKGVPFVSLLDTGFC